MESVLVLCVGLCLRGAAERIDRRAATQRECHEEIDQGRRIARDFR